MQSVIYIVADVATFFACRGFSYHAATGAAIETEMRSRFEIWGPV